MQDRFKFRAFLKDEAKRNVSKPFIMNKIFDVLSIGFDSDNLPETVTLLGYHENGDFSVYEVDAKDVELIQCTGMKDKNGKLIYEGDILAIHTHFDRLVPDSNEYRYADEKGISYFKVAYDNDKARFYLIRTKWIKWNTRHTMLDYIPTNHSIAGNIYDNPEVLEEYLQ